jgi:glycerol-3-phosphate dehydrogenase
VFARTTLPVRESLVLGDAGGRIVFAMPHDRYVLVGTTDTDFTGDPVTVTAEVGDVEYLLGVLATSLPGIKLEPRDVLSSFAGLRALVLAGEQGERPSSVSREEVIEESNAGLLSVAGGKLTTHREIAQKLVDKVLKSLGRAVAKCPTLTSPLPGARPLRADEKSSSDSAALKTIPAAAAEILKARYGTRAAIVARIAVERPEWAALLTPGCPVIKAEVVHAARNEMVHSIQDFLIRRTALSWRSPVEAEAAAPVVAQLLASELGWDAAKEKAELAGYVTDQRARRVEV